jgi:hypothetical protein
LIFKARANAGIGRYRLDLSILISWYADATACRSCARRGLVGCLAASTGQMDRSTGRGRCCPLTPTRGDGTRPTADILSVPPPPKRGPGGSQIHLLRAPAHLPPRLGYAEANRRKRLLTSSSARLLHPTMGLAMSGPLWRPPWRNPSPLFETWLRPRWGFAALNSSYDCFPLCQMIDLKLAPSHREMIAQREIIEDGLARRASKLPAPKSRANASPSYCPRSRGDDSESQKSLRLLHVEERHELGDVGILFRDHLGEVGR